MPESPRRINKLHIADELVLSLESVTQKFAFMGQSGSGKTYAATKLAELMLEAGAQIAALDPVGVWWSLRLAADGKSPGFPIPVFGGLHADLPLPPDSGALVADILVDQRISAVLDVSQMISAEQAKFATAFGEHFFQRLKGAPSAVHLFVEECQEFVPQNPQQGETHMLHEWERLIKIGRNFGIGVSLISQRPQEVAKKALNQAGTIFAFNMVGSQERAAMKAWVQSQDAPADVVDMLPNLKIGQPYVHSPRFLKLSRIVHIRKKKTYDASETPRVGESRIQPRELSPVDIEALRKAMGEAGAAAISHDPAASAARIRELEQEIEALRAQPAVSPDVQEKLVQAWRLANSARSVCESIGGHIEELQEALKLPVARSAADAPTPLMQIVRDVSAKLDRDPEPPAPPASGPALKAGARRMVQVLSRYHPRPLTRIQLGTLAGMSPRSGTYSNYLGAIRSAGFIQEQGQLLSLTPEGLTYAGGPGKPLSQQEVRALWSKPLKAGARRMLDFLIKVYPSVVSRQQLAAAADISPDSGTFSNYLGTLRSNALIIEPAGKIKAADIFFLDQK